MKIRQHIIFKGRVQGVGFRYYSEHKARQLGLTGWVMNLYNGDVEMEVQGDPVLIDELISFLGGRRYIYIDDMIVRQQPVIEESGFYEKDIY
mgnify:CR=1 FL=1